MRAGSRRATGWLIAVILVLGGAPACRKGAAPGQGGEPAGGAVARAGAGAEPWAAMFEAWRFPDPIPPVAFTDQEGEAFNLGDWRDHHVLVGFVFTRCPSPKACPLTMKRMRQVQDLWASKEAAGATKGRSLRLLTVTFDPEFDTPPILKAYGQAHGVDFSRWKLCTGPEKLVATDFPSLFNVLAVPDFKGSINHSVKVALLGPGLRFRHDWRNNEFTAEEVTDLVLAEAPDEGPGADAGPSR